MELKQDDWDSTKSCSQILRDCLGPVLSCYTVAAGDLGWSHWLLFLPRVPLVFQWPLSRVQCLPGDRVMTPPLHCPTDTQDTATTGHHWSSSSPEFGQYSEKPPLYCLHFYYKKVRPTWQKLNSPRRDQILCILNHHFIISRIPDP